MARIKLHQYEKEKDFSDRVSDTVTSFVGSWRFIVFQSILYLSWMAINTLALIEGWDPYPFVFLNLVIALENIYVAPLIMMSQNKQEEKNKVRDDADFEADIKTEKMIEHLKTEIDTIQKQVEEVRTILVNRDSH